MADVKISELNNDLNFSTDSLMVTVTDGTTFKLTGEALISFVQNTLEQMVTTNGNIIKFWRGTTAQYNALETHDTNTFYVITDDTTVDDMKSSIASLQGDVRDIQGVIGDLEGVTLEDSIQAFEVNDGMRVTKVRSNVSQSITSSSEKTFTESSQTSSGIHLSNTVYQPLDFPITQGGAVTGTLNKNGMWLVNTNYVSPGMVSYRVASPYAFSGSTNSAYVKLNVESSHAIPPISPSRTSGTTKEQAIAVAKTYITARQNGRAFAYGANFTYDSGNFVNDSRGRALMVCSTFVFMVMTGIPYESSPYTNTQSSYTYNFNNLVVNPNNYSWCFSWKSNPDLGRRITTTHSQNWFFWHNSMVFSDITQLQNGDIAIFREKTEPYFDNIGHIGIIEMVDSVPYLLHVSSSAYTEGNIVDRRPLSDYLTRRNFYNPDDVYFARPIYANS